MKLEGKQRKLYNLIERWVEEQIEEYNKSRAEKEQIRLAKKDAIQFDFSEPEIANGKKGLKKLKLKKEGEILFLRENFEKIGSTRNENRRHIDQATVSYPNVGKEIITKDVTLKFNTEKVFEKETTESTTHELNVGLGASAFGVDAQIGYTGSWSVSTKERTEERKGEGTELNIPVVIPPGGITYIFNYYRTAVIQDYQIDLVLRGHVDVYFDNAHQIEFKNGKFSRTEEKHAFLSKNKITVSIVDIFQDLKRGGTFPDAGHWQFDEATSMVSYQDKVSVFQFFSAEIEPTAKPQPGLDVQSTSATKCTLEESEASKDSTNKVLEKLGGSFVVKRTEVAVDMPESLGKDPLFASDIKEKMKAGISANPNFLAVLQKYGDPNCPESAKKALEGLMNKMVEGAPNQDAKYYLDWLVKNAGKVHRFEKAEFETKVVDLCIRAREEKIEEKHHEAIPQAAEPQIKKVEAIEENTSRSNNRP